MDIGKRLSKLSMEKLKALHKELGLDKEHYPKAVNKNGKIVAAYQCPGDYVLEIIEKDEEEIISALEKIEDKK